MTTPIALADSVTAEACVQVDLYYYFDGNNTNITTEKYEANTLTNSQIDLRFAVTNQ